MEVKNYRIDLEDANYLFWPQIYLLNYLHYLCYTWNHEPDIHSIFTTWYIQKVSNFNYHIKVSMETEKINFSNLDSVSTNDLLLCFNILFQFLWRTFPFMWWALDLLCRYFRSNMEIGWGVCGGRYI